MYTYNLSTEALTGEAEAEDHKLKVSLGFYKAGAYLKLNLSLSLLHTSKKKEKEHQSLSNFPKGFTK